jgi:hypothetical protein
MPSSFRSVSLALSLAVLCLPAAAALRCASVNGNVSCSGSGAVSCQTVDGHKVCVGGDGAAVQSFGGQPMDEMADDTADTDEANTSRPLRNPGLTLRRDGTRLHLRSDRLRIDMQ